MASLAALAMAATSAFATQHEPPGMKSVVASASPHPGFQKTGLRCLMQNPCTGVGNKDYLKAGIPTHGISGGSGDVYGGFRGQVPQASEVKTKKDGQFTPGGHYVVGAHLLPTWDGRVHT